VREKERRKRVIESTRSTCNLNSPLLPTNGTALIYFAFTSFSFHLENNSSINLVKKFSNFPDIFIQNSR